MPATSRHAACGRKIGISDQFPARNHEADAPIRGMLELHPDASGAYQLIARRAERLEQWPEAAEAYDRDAELIEKGRDRLRTHPRPDVLVDSLRASAAYAREGPGER